MVDAFLKPHFSSFEFSYRFNELGEIVGVTQRHYTDRNAYETDRYVRKAIEAVYDFNDKDNRQLSPKLSQTEKNELISICDEVNSGVSSGTFQRAVMLLIERIQKRIINEL